MSSKSPSSKSGLMRTVLLAVILLIIAALAYASVHLVNQVPQAFGSLAKVAQTIDEFRPDTDNTSNLAFSSSSPLTVSNSKESVASGEDMVLNWTAVDSDGSYVFSYTCSDGVSLKIVETEGTRMIECDTNYDLGDVDNLTLLVESSEERLANVDYTLSFISSETGITSHSEQTQFSVTNDTLLDSIVAVAPEVAEPQSPEEVEVTTGPTIEILSSSPTTTEVDTEEPEDTDPELTITEAITVATSSPAEQPATAHLASIAAVAIPTVDLQASFMNVGSILNEELVIGPVTQGASGAFQFIVENIGTSISEPWTYNVMLPTQVYRSPVQAPLRSGERATISLGFPTTFDNQHTFVVNVAVVDDINTNNNEIIQVISFVQ